MSRFRSNHAFLVCIFLAIIVIFNCCRKESDDNLNCYNGKTTALFNTEVAYDSITDVEGNIYKTIIIGTQTWMAENLRTTTYNDGTPILAVKDDSEWATLETGAYCNINNTEDETLIATYGRLYNFYAVSTGLLAPIGWHVPTNEDWAVLCSYIGDHTLAGGPLKETGTLHWNEPNTGATNITGFTGLPGGFRYCDGTFNDVGDYGYWWSSTETGTNGAHGRNLYSFYNYLYYAHYYKAAGFSVRCVKD